MSASISLLARQAPGLTEGVTYEQEATFIEGEWGMYSDMRGRASGLLRELVAEIKRLESTPCSGACLLKIKAFREDPRIRELLNKAEDYP